MISHTKNNSPGESKINKTILTKLPDSVIKELAEIFSHTLSMGYFPHNSKQATIKLIPKQGKDPRNPQNYRPISLLEIPGKIFERIITLGSKYIRRKQHPPTRSTRLTQ